MSALEQSWIQYQRNASRPKDRPTPRRAQCPDCDSNALTDLDTFRAHVRANSADHESLRDDASIEQAFRQISLRNQLPDAGESRSGKRPLPRPTDQQEDETDPDRVDSGGDAADIPRREGKRRCSPPASDTRQHGSIPSTPTSRSRARPTMTSPAARPLSHKNPSGRRLWQEGDEMPQRSRQHPQKHPSVELQRSQQQQQQQQQPPPTKQDSDALSRESSAPNSDAPKFRRQPDTRPISQEQLVSEVKGIYAGLVMVETKCIDVNRVHAQSTDPRSEIKPEQWQALIALHRTLLHEHHDFFLASQHPSASPALRRLPSKYSMPARMWRHGIHSFLELLRHRLPESRDFMLAYIYLAYSIMALLQETVPAFEETWIECLGDLGRYRMAIEEEDIRDREIWTGVSKHWYSKASEKAPTTGRLYHHLAILARPHALQQLFCYSKSLCVVIPFSSAKESIITLFDPLLTSDKNNSRIPTVDAAFVRVQGVLFTGKAKDKFDNWQDEFLTELDGHIGRTARRWLESGYFIGISLACSLLGFGDENNVLMRAVSEKPEDADNSEAMGVPGATFEAALCFAVQTWSVVIKRWGDLNTLPCHHTMLVFVLHMARYPKAITHIEKMLPWKLISIMLNYLKSTTSYRPKQDEDDGFAAPLTDQHRPLPDDYALRGLIYAEDYLPKDRFPDNIDEDEKYFEQGSMAEERVKRILWLGCKVARLGNWMTWDAVDDSFSCAPQYDVEIEEPPGLGTPERGSSPAAVGGEE